jgi:hypothetical protein
VEDEGVYIQASFFRKGMWNGSDARAIANQEIETFQETEWHGTDQRI